MPVEIDVNGAIVPDGDKWIYDWFEEPCTTPGDIRNKLRNANGQDIQVLINSYGGDVFSASEIYTLLKSCTNNVNIKITGLAASAASVIAMAGYSEITPTGQVMIHPASTGAQGDYRTMDATSKNLRTADKSIANAYCIKSGMSLEAALKLMDEVTWMTAQDAKALGLVDKILFMDDGEEEVYQNQLFNNVLKESAKAMYASIPRLSPSVINKMRNSKRNEDGNEDVGKLNRTMETFVDQDLESAKAYLNYLKLKGNVKND